jgi:hypothetical protein
MGQSVRKNTWHAADGRKTVEARVLLKKGDKSAATATAQDGVKAATEMKSDEYIRLNTEVIAEAGK